MSTARHQGEVWSRRVRSAEEINFHSLNWGALSWQHASVHTARYWDVRRLAATSGAPRPRQELRRARAGVVAQRQIRGHIIAAEAARRMAARCTSHTDITTVTNTGTPERHPLPNVLKSHESPSASPSAFTCVGFLMRGQLSVKPMPHHDASCAGVPFGLLLQAPSPSVS